MQVVYCSKECQRFHWFQGHRETCKKQTRIDEETSTFLDEVRDFEGQPSTFAHVIRDFHGKRVARSLRKFCRLASDATDGTPEPLAGSPEWVGDANLYAQIRHPKME